MLFPKAGLDRSLLRNATKACRRSATLRPHVGAAVRCNLACAGCGKIQYPAHILKRADAEECFKRSMSAARLRCPFPAASPMHSEIDKIVEGLVARKI